MEIALPDLATQQRLVFVQATQEAINQLQTNLAAPVLPGQDEINEADYSRLHLLREREGWEPPHPDVVGAYFRHFQRHFPEFGTDAKLASLLGLSSDRRVRDYKAGSAKVPYGIWRRFLVLTGRAPQEVIPVLAFMG